MSIHMYILLPPQICLRYTTDVHHAKIHGYQSYPVPRIKFSVSTFEKFAVFERQGRRSIRFSAVPNGRGP